MGEPGVLTSASVVPEIVSEDPGPLPGSVHVVVGRGGRDEDEVEWLVAAYVDRERASQHAEAAEAEVGVLYSRPEMYHGEPGEFDTPMRFHKSCSDERPLTYHDPDPEHLERGTTYYPVEVVLRDRSPEVPAGEVVTVAARLEEILGPGPWQVVPDWNGRDRALRVRVVRALAPPDAGFWKDTGRYLTGQELEAVAALMHYPRHFPWDRTVVSSLGVTDEVGVGETSVGDDDYDPSPDRTLIL